MKANIAFSRQTNYVFSSKRYFEYCVLMQNDLAEELLKDTMQVLK